MKDLNYEFDNNPDESSVNYIKEELNKYNQKFSQPDNYKKLEIIVRVDNKIIAGLAGCTYWGWFYIDRFWIEESYRGKGLGSKILNKAESEAVKRGCKFAHLDTHDFQALQFYKKKGYRVKSRLKDLPEGYYKYLMWKKLA